MSKKKNQQSQPTTSFSASPFKSLKGLAVFEEKAPPATEEPMEELIEKPPVAPLSAKADEDLFAREMERLGLDRGDDEDVIPVANQPESSQLAEQEVSEEVIDGEDFLAAMRDLRVDFQDEIPGEPSLPQVSARREKQLRRGQLEPEETLDLHGLTREQARDKVQFFLDDAIYQGARTVLIITGKGHGSTGEPVLRTEVERLLRLEEGKSVLEWMVAPPRYGGGGALVVFLKKRG